MRVRIALLAVLGLAAVAGTLVAAADSAYVVALVQQPGGGAQPAPDVDIDITTRTVDGGPWWNNPVWIGVGIVALILLVVIVALATRGGGTTIVKE